MNFLLTSLLVLFADPIAEKIAPAPAEQRLVILVPEEYRTIQAAIDAAPQAGSLIRVAPGTYSEVISFKGKNTVVSSQQPEDAVTVAATIIHGGGADCVVVFEGSETDDAGLIGFTITGGAAGGISGGAGRARATISRNTICHNGGAKFGYGIQGMHGVIEYNDIHSNRGAETAAGIQGCNGVIRYNTIRNNNAPRAGNGIRASYALIEHNQIIGNTGESGRGVIDCDGVIRGNLIGGNSGSSYGCGIRDCEGTIENNIVVSHSGTIAGRGLWICTGDIRNNTIYGNSHYGIQQCNAVAIRNNIIWGNGKIEITDDSRNPEYCCIQGWTLGGLGNISENPQIRNPNNLDFRLNVSSPCIDTGMDARAYTDYRGLPRPLDGDGRNGAQHDIGAVECNPFNVVASSR